MKRTFVALFGACAGCASGQVEITDIAALSIDRVEIEVADLTQDTFNVPTGNSALGTDVNRFFGPNVSFRHMTEPVANQPSDFGNLQRIAGGTQINASYFFPTAGPATGANGMRISFDQPVAEFGFFYDAVVFGANLNRQALFYNASGSLLADVRTVNMGPDPIRFLGLSSPSDPIAFVEYRMIGMPPGVGTPVLRGSFAYTFVPSPAGMLAVLVAAPCVVACRR